MKVNTDGVLLGAAVVLTGDERHILDIGTGTGVIALMMAQRSPEALVEGVEIDTSSAEEARLNFASSIWTDCGRVVLSQVVNPVRWILVDDGIICDRARSISRGSDRGNHLWVDILAQGVGVGDNCACHHEFSFRSLCDLF